MIARVLMVCIIGQLLVFAFMVQQALTVHGRILPLADAFLAGAAVSSAFWMAWDVWRWRHDGN